ncbi:amino acid permease [Candidatus Pacearchaeota archaeon]|nr:amino acid permease [Candidatus Pacearchaeota archaeon]
MNKIEKKRFFVATSILVGTCIGAGVLGIPYVAASAGFLVALAYIVLLAMVLLTVNLYMGEIALRTKGNHHIAGYAEKYLGKKGKFFAEFALIFGIYSAIIAYLFGVGESFSVLIFNHAGHASALGVLFGFFMSFLLWRGMKSLRKFEEIGVSMILFLLAIIVLVFFRHIEISNLLAYNISNIFVPFGVILFALLSFSAIPEVNIVLRKHPHLLKKSLITGALIPVIFYILFALVVVGFKGVTTPEIATLALGPLFIVLGIFTMFTSYLALGMALEDNLKYDEKYSQKKSWFLVTIVPIILFLFIKYFEYFSFTKMLSIGGVIAGGLTAILILLMAVKAKKKGNREPEYSFPINWFIIIFLSLIFVLGIITEVLAALR